MQQTLERGSLTGRSPGNEGEVSSVSVLLPLPEGPDAACLFCGRKSDVNLS